MTGDLFYVSGHIGGHTFTCGVVVGPGDIIVDAAPLLRKFKGQPFANLMGWRAVESVRLVEKVHEQDAQA